MKRALREIHREHLGAARGLRCIWKQSLEQDGLTADAEIRDLRIGAISYSHYWLNAATEARRQIAHQRQYGNNPPNAFQFVTTSFQQYNPVPPKLRI